ncbi:MAG: propionyl-CoA--succinate CoA transferase [Actinomycetia bacterium]|nr:propionyl-CoA--succinate CoA transferase [Actinomycetes bacterium]MCP4223993.1 propionyl-CoA--succinate CoA transferase [Actinomycetes bacterium]
MEALVEQLQPGADLVVPLANGEPVGLLDELEARADRLSGVRIHQMHAIRDRPYLNGAFRGHLDHVAWFLSSITRPLYHAGLCEFAPANFSEVPQFLLAKKPAAVLAAASPPDRLGYFSLGVNADYAASMIGRVPFLLEVNERMPRTHGSNRLHHSEIAGWCKADYELIEVEGPAPGPEDQAIAHLVADRVPNGATLQLGIGSIPGAVATLLADHHDLGVHTELLTDHLVDLVEAGAVTGINKRANRGRIVTTFALGTKRLYDFCDQNDTVMFLSVDEVNDPRNIGREPNFISINGSLEVDLFGQCASETLGAMYWSGSGGQADFARGAQYSQGGDGFIVLRSTAKDGRISRISPTLKTGAVVTTPKNTVDNVVTEHGVAELRGRTIAERASALIGVAAPHHRDHLTSEARALGLLR